MHRLLAIIALVTLGAFAQAETATPLIDLSKLNSNKLSNAHTTVTSKGDALFVCSDEAGVQGTVQLDRKSVV